MRFKGMEIVVLLTEKQIEYLYHGPSADGRIERQGDLVIEEVDEQGWIFVHNPQHANEEGSGVWVDTEGVEHYGP